MINKFLEYIEIERHYSQRTIGEYERDLKEFCSFLRVDPAEFDPTIATSDDVRMWIVYMMDQGLAISSVKRKVSSLRSFFRFLLKVKVVQCDVTRAVITPKSPKPLPVFFRDAEVEDALCDMGDTSNFVTRRDMLIISILYETGIRQAEMLGLMDGSIDESESQIRVFGKRKKERIIPIGINLLAQIQAYRQLRNERFGIISSPQQPLLLSEKGTPLTKHLLYVIVRTRMGAVSTLKKHSPHVLRHTFATSMFNNGADINTIKTLLGHASLAATQIYTHASFDQLRIAYQQSHPRARKNENEGKITDN